MTRIARQEGLAFTQVNVALEFLKERGIVDVRHRRCYPGTRDVHLDAMIEFHALAEERKPA
jgi:predicted transcriptional regulator